MKEQGRQSRQIRTPWVAETGPICLKLGVAMKELGVGKTKMYELIANGEVEAIKIGRATMILRESLLALIERAERL